MARQKQILILVTGDPVAPVRERRGGFVPIIQEALGSAWPGEYAAVDARKDELDDAADEADAIVITGSSANVHTREPWIVEAEEWLREQVRERPVLGLCFGHQLLAQALGGEVQPNPNGREISTVTIERLDDDPLFDGLDKRFSANACHVDSVVRLPPKARVLARSPLDPHQALRFGERCYGVQFHPEFDRDVMRGYLEARAPQISAEGLDLEGLTAAASDTPDGLRILANFIRHAVLR